MFKKGDEVRILKKSTGYHIDTTPFKVGDIGIYQYPYSPEKGVHCINNREHKTQWNFKDGDFVLNQTIELGDKVEILGKSLYSEIQDARNNIGDIVIINKTSKGNHGIEYSPNDGFDFYLEKDLRKIGGQMYKFKKDLYVIDVLKSSSPSDNEKRKFYDWVLKDKISLVNPIEMTDNFIQKFENSNCFKDWLYEKGYLEKEFKPFTIPLEITSNRMYWTLWYRLAVDGLELKDYQKRQQKEGRKCDIENKDTNTLFDFVEKYLDKVDKSEK